MNGFRIKEPQIVIHLLAQLLGTCPQGPGMDSLNTHGIESLNQTYAWALAQRLETCYTPLHGSWLNMAEIGLTAPCGQCLNRRIADLRAMRQQVNAWEQHRNNRQSKIDWQFTTRDARTKLKRLNSNQALLQDSRSTSGQRGTRRNRAHGLWHRAGLPTAIASGRARGTELGAARVGRSRRFVSCRGWVDDRVKSLRGLAG